MLLIPTANNCIPYMGLYICANIIDYKSSREHRNNKQCGEGVDMLDPELRDRGYIISQDEDEWSRGDCARHEERYERAQDFFLEWSSQVHGNLLLLKISPMNSLLTFLRPTLHRADGAASRPVQAGVIADQARSATPSTMCWQIPSRSGNREARWIPILKSSRLTVLLVSRWINAFIILPPNGSTGHSS